MASELQNKQQGLWGHSVPKDGVLYNRFHHRHEDMKIKLNWMYFSWSIPNSNSRDSAPQGYRIWDRHLRITTQDSSIFPKENRKNKVLNQQRQLILWWYGYIGLYEYQKTRPNINSLTIKMKYQSIKQKVTFIYLKWLNP